MSYILHSPSKVTCSQHCLLLCFRNAPGSSLHYNDVIMNAMVSQITSLTIVYSTVCSRCRSKKASKLRVTGLCVGNSPVTGDFPARRASNAENASVWWRHHVNDRDRGGGILVEEENAAWSRMFCSYLQQVGHAFWLILYCITLNLRGLLVTCRAFHFFPEVTFSESE